MDIGIGLKKVGILLENSGKEYAHFMSKKKKDEPFDPANLTPEELLKYEIATELGLSDKVLQHGWKSLTSKESGRIGGLVTKRKRELKREALSE